MREKSTRKGKSARKVPPSWRFQFTPRAAALAGRIADAMTAHFRPSDEDGGAFTSAGVINEAIGKGLACMAVQYLHDADALNPGDSRHLVNVVSVRPPLPLPITAERETAIQNVQRFELDGLWEFVKRMEKRIADVRETQIKGIRRMLRKDVAEDRRQRKASKAKGKGR